VPWLRRLVDGKSPRSPGFAPGSIHVGFVVGKVALGQVFLLVLRFYPVNIIPSLFSILISSREWTICPLLAAVQRRSLYYLKINQSLDVSINQSINQSMKPGQSVRKLMSTKWTAGVFLFATTTSSSSWIPELYNEWSLNTHPPPTPLWYSTIISKLDGWWNVQAEC
jgi:hypothetical protein